MATLCLASNTTMATTGPASFSAPPTCQSRGLSSLVHSARPLCANRRFSTTTWTSPRRSAYVKAEAPSQETNTPLPQTKREIDREEVERRQGEEPLRVFSGSAAEPFFRPETERRPEFGNTSPESVMRFDGPGPETINGRLAMLGFAAAMVGEALTGLSVREQLLQSNGFLWFLAISLVFVWASFVPIFNGESPDSRAFGPFNATAERWVGRTAMFGVVALLVTEWLKQGPLLGPW